MVTWILTTLAQFLNIQKDVKQNDQIQRDRKLADDIKQGRGEDVARDFERRKKYNE